jgi:hypothetical protein
MEQTMTVSPYYMRAQTLFEGESVIRKGGFGVEVWGKGADHNDLLQIKKPTWRILATDGAPVGCEGIEVHFESCRPGHWVLHCELFPRLGKKAKAQVTGVPELLELKGEVTRLIRDLGREMEWEKSYGAHLRRARENPADPSSLIVYTFDLGLPDEHSPEQFVNKVVPIIEATSPAIDDIVMEMPRR